MTYVPLYDRILVRRLDAQLVSKGGLHLPSAAQEKPREGKVISVGDGRISQDGKITPLIVKAGDTVLFGKFAGDEIRIDDVEHLIIREQDILALIRE